MRTYNFSWQNMKTLGVCMIGTGPYDTEPSEPSNSGDESEPEEKKPFCPGPTIASVLRKKNGSKAQTIATALNEDNGSSGGSIK